MSVGIIMHNSIILHYTHIHTTNIRYIVDGYNACANVRIFFHLLCFFFFSSFVNTEEFSIFLLFCFLPLPFLFVCECMCVFFLHLSLASSFGWWIIIHIYIAQFKSNFSHKKAQLKITKSQQRTYYLIY